MVPRPLESWRLVMFHESKHLIFECSSQGRGPAGPGKVGAVSPEMVPGPLGSSLVDI